MDVIRAKEFTAERAWGAKTVANMNGVTTRLHWTDQPYKWHINDGEEVFVVLDGRVEMYYRECLGDEKIERSVVLHTGDIFFASVGTEHVAHPLGEARILVVEKAGSI
ncbi:cupin domain-containing protein [Simiduia curdlanivorans]|uniref:Cupin domain-containing protein n=1 Tax=Simiduia curdlanivorans TaxID=1492769 RepID=A0ABV8V091_9GAMM|nr:cupin domain-containing protein [Simiduia curdlanivorans]MDN3637826.1 cupin domain-containing protein [Simiduia curdlanivorans]